jgi:hypothetical protein
MGWWLYQRYLSSCDPAHNWLSHFRPDAKNPCMEQKDGRPGKVVEFSAADWDEIIRQAKHTWSKRRREQLLHKVNFENLDKRVAGRIANKNGLAPIPAQLTYIPDNIPQQEWLSLGEVIGALILGSPVHIARTEHLHLTNDAEEEAARALFQAAYRGDVQIHGKDPLDGQFRQMQSIRFQEEFEKFLWRDEIGFKDGSGRWRHCVVEVDTLRDWMKREAEADRARKRPPASLPKKTKPGRKAGTSQYPDDDKLMAGLDKKYSDDRGLNSLSKSLVCQVAEDLGLMTKGFNAEGTTHRLRRKLIKKYPHLEHRIGLGKDAGNKFGN